VGRLGVITGLAREADCIGALPHQERPLVRCVGGDSKSAGEAARSLVAEGCIGLVSFGIAGGLQPTLVPGMLVVAASVIGPNRSCFPCDPAWRRRLMAVLGANFAVEGSDVVGRDRPVLLSTEKRRLHERTGAAAVDMESHAVSQIAAERGVPFLAVRAIADPADRDIPAWVPGLVGADGRPRAWAVIAGLAAHPHHVPAVISLGRDSEKAFAALRRVALTAGPLLQFGA
jgi:hopanoid-associated phosphorylase